MSEAEASPPTSASIGRDLLAAALWAAIPLGFVVAIEGWGLPYEPLPDQPEKDPSYALVIYALIAAGGVLGSLSDVGRWLLPGRLLAGEDFRAALQKVTGKAIDVQLERPPRVVPALVVMALGLLVVVLSVVFRSAVFVPALATLGLSLVFSFALVGGTAQRAARRGENPRRWWQLDPDEPIGLDALETLPDGPGKRLSHLVWRRALLVFLVIVAASSVIDQATKVWAQQSFAVVDERKQTVHLDGKTERRKVRKFFNSPRAELHIIPSALSFKYAENPAAAFSLTGNLPYWLRRPLLVGVSTLAVLFIGLWFFLQQPRRPHPLRLRHRLHQRLRRVHQPALHMADVQHRRQRHRRRRAHRRLPYLPAALPRAEHRRDAGLERPHRWPARVAAGRAHGEGRLMYLARAIGTVVATRKVEGLEGTTLLLVQPLDNQRQPVGDKQVAVDRAQAGEGDLVTCVGSREAALACDPTFVPVDAAIVGIVDRADVLSVDEQRAAASAKGRA